MALLLAGAVSAHAGEHLRLATTTSTQDSGLLERILPPFEKRFGLTVDVIAVGTGKALKLGENGDADVVLTHAPELELAFVEAGFGVNARAVMYNDFVLLGPPDDPAGVRGSTSAAQALARIAEKEASFISRGDESGTHQKEKELWKLAQVSPSGPWYISAGQGMGKVLLMADEKHAYALSDRGTFLAYRKRGDLVVLVENDPPLRNPYAVMAVNPARYPDIKYIEAMQLIAWLTSPAGQRMIGEFQIDGKSLFEPLAVPRETR